MNREEGAGANVWSRTNLAIQKRTHRNWETVADRDRRDASKAAAARKKRPKRKEERRNELLHKKREKRREIWSRNAPKRTHPGRLKPS